MKLAVRPALGRLGGAEASILIGSAIGAVGVMWFPGQLGVAAGAGTEYAFGLEALALALALAAIVAVARRHPGRRYVALIGDLLSPALAPAVAVLVAALDLTLAGVVLSASAVTIFSEFLPLTPLWAVELLLLVPAVYGAGLGVETLARALDLAAPLTLGALAVVCLFTLSQARFGPAVLPHVPVHGGWGAILRGAYTGAWALGGLTLVPNICAQIAPEHARRLSSRVALGAAAAALTAFGLLVLDLAVLGVTGLSWYEWPTVSVLRQTRTEAFLINRVSGLDTWVLVVMIWAFVGLHLWNAAVNLGDALAGRRRGDRGPAMPAVHALLLVGLSLLVFAVSRAFGVGAQLGGFTGGYVAPAVVAVALALPIVLWVVDAGRRAVRRRSA